MAVEELIELNDANYSIKKIKWKSFQPTDCPPPSQGLKLNFA